MKHSYFKQVTFQQRPFKQKGVALIIVLMIVAIVSVLATEMGSRLQLQIRRATNIKDNNQAYWYAMGAEQYARKSIKLLMEQDGDVIHLQQEWNQEFVYPIDGGGIQAQLVDMQSCFNLNALREPSSSNNSNNLTSNNTTPLDNNTAQGNSPAAPTTNTGPLLPDRVLAFQRLLQEVEPAIPSYNAEILRDSLIDWLDEDNSPLQLGAEDSEYESLQFPYVTANNYMLDKSELRIVNGVQAAWLNELLKFVCVLPNDSLFSINVNTVSEENVAVIAAATGLSLADAQSAISNRGEDGFKEPADFLTLSEVQALNLTQEQRSWFDVKTSHFILHTKTKYNNATFAMQSVLKVGQDNKVSVVRRDFSGF